MREKLPYEKIVALIEPKKSGDRAWFLSLLDDATQKEYEENHMEATMQMLRIAHIRPRKNLIKETREEIARMESEERSAENYRKIGLLTDEIKKQESKIDEFRPFFNEPYFARMDLIDNIEGYNSYYIGKKGDVKLEIVDWRAPVARRYYQKSCSFFTINEYEYKTILRRAIRTANGKVLDFKNEYLSLRGYLSEEEIADRDEENVLDPYLREIIRKRKEESAVKDIIETIQEKQYEIITHSEKSNFVLQGCAGSGKTMVMLHRLSYLMYNNEEIKPRDVLVITPSNSFNAFIDELAEILELERVRTVTVYEYFLMVLKNEKIDLKDKIDLTQKEDPAYLEYVYSPKFVADVTEKLQKTYQDLYGLFTSVECQEFVERLIDDARERLSAYESIKNSTTRVRRAVLGEIKEKKDGGLYYTRPFRELMNCILDVEDFLSGTIRSENAKKPDYFYRQMLSFYKSAAFAVRYTEQITDEAIASLSALATDLEKEIFDLKRYRQKIGSMEIYTYADRIERRKELLKEVEEITEKVRCIGEDNTALSEFFLYLRCAREFCELGNCKDFVDIARYFYRETVKKYKTAYRMTSSKMYKSDAYALCVVCSRITDRLSPVFSYLFVDEAQDISKSEYDLLRYINKKAAFNVFGDIAQNVTPWRGIANWQDAFPDFEIFTLNQNYRNTNQIVRFVSENLQLNMQPIGFDGPEVERITPRGITAFFKDKKGLKAVICSEEKKSEYMRKSYNDPSVKGKISRTKINIMTVYESKGLEFSSVAVVSDGMTTAEWYIAYTRALKDLAVVQTKGKE